MAGGEPPDVIWFDRYAVAEWAARNAFEPLDPYIERDLKNGVPDAVNLDDFYEPCRNEPTYDGVTYGIATSVDNRALFYNKDLLQRAADDTRLLDLIAPHVSAAVGRPLSEPDRGRLHHRMLWVLGDVGCSIVGTRSLLAR